LTTAGVSTNHTEKRRPRAAVTADKKVVALLQPQKSYQQLN